MGRILMFSGRVARNSAQRFAAPSLPQCCRATDELSDRPLGRRPVMKHALTSLFAIAGAAAIPAGAQQPVDADCSAAATQATGYTPGADSGPDGSRVSGAAKGAA